MAYSSVGAKKKSPRRSCRMRIHTVSPGAEGRMESSHMRALVVRTGLPSLISMTSCAPPSQETAVEVRPSDPSRGSTRPSTARPSFPPRPFFQRESPPPPFEAPESGRAHIPRSNSTANFSIYPPTSRTTFSIVTIWLLYFFRFYTSATLYLIKRLEHTDKAHF